MTKAADRLLALVRNVPDFPEPGILFRDLTPMLADPAGLSLAIEMLAAAALAGPPPDLIAGLEARGFLFGVALAERLGTGFVPLRKAGKLPPPVHAVDYQLEYGTARLELACGTVPTGARVLLVDDLLATGGTAIAGARLLREAGAEVEQALFVIALEQLGGRAALAAEGLASTALLDC
ncbi:adenine phosphoribosyltransferase [Croceibacterium sp. TMG7-5b_MA50]|uniref:adenine phosphoribosyltransferase n=1 Tax=Croceibacterium sp. TMG7-5b_MA50 TaxID=3121290 RepID=UPI003221B230